LVSSKNVSGGARPKIFLKQGDDEWLIKFRAKNFSFIYNKGWRFASAYDLLPCGSAVDHHTTSVHDNPLPGRADVLLLAEQVGLDSKLATAIFDEITQLSTSN